MTTESHEQLDPSENGVPPAEDMIRRALHVAQQELAHRTPGSHPSRGYWRGTIAALQWSLGQSTVSPLSETVARVDLGEPQRETVMRETYRAHSCITRQAPVPEDLEVGYLEGVENTLHWVARGTGFIANLSDEALRQAANSWK